jgi:hypothetical protein
MGAQEAEMKKNQVNDSLEEAKDGAGSAAGNDSVNADLEKSGAMRTDNGTYRSRFGSLTKFLGKTM